MLTGNTDAVVAGQHSAAFWREAEAAKSELRDQYIASRGYDVASAPQDLYDLCDGTAEQVIMRRGTWLRVIETAGPISQADRRRSPYHVWRDASSRAQSGLKDIAAYPRREKDAIDLARAIQESRR